MEAVLLWKRLCYLLIGLVSLQTVFLYYKPQETLRATFDGSQSSPRIEGHIPTVDLEEAHVAGVLGLRECNALYPQLYHQVDRSVHYWKDRQHTIDAKDVDVSWRGGDHAGGIIRILIADNQLRILESNGSLSHPGYVERALGILGLLHRAVGSSSAAGEKLPNIEASIILEDIADPPTSDGTHSFWSWTSKMGNVTHERIWILPSFDLWSIGSMGDFEDVRFRMVQQNNSFAENIPKVVWRGTGWVNWDLRRPLIDLTKGKAWADVAIVDWTDRVREMPVGEFCKYAITVHTEGVSYSGRLKYLQNCNSLIFIHDPLEWSAYYYHLLEKEGPKQNYVPVRRDWSDLEERVQYYLSHPEEAEKIISNSIATFRQHYLTTKATSCYLRKLIHGYASVSFTPELYRQSSPGQLKKRRSLSYEQFMNRPHDFDEEM